MAFESGVVPKTGELLWLFQCIRVEEKGLKSN